MASGPETPRLACLMFSIPKRLPTPAPAWEPRALRPKRRGSSSLSWRAVDWLGLEKWRKLQDGGALSWGERGPGMLRPSIRIYSWAPKSQESGEERNVTVCGNSLEIGASQVEIAWGPRKQGKLGPVSEHRARRPRPRGYQGLEETVPCALAFPRDGLAWESSKRCLNALDLASSTGDVWIWL